MSTNLDTFAAALAAQAPAGWTVDHGAGLHDGFDVWTRGTQEYRWVTFARSEAGADVVIALNMKAVPDGDGFDARWARKDAFGGFSVDGHTTFNGRTFTRRGIDVNSCALIDDAAERVIDSDYADLATLLAGELARCVKAVSASKTARAIPGTPFSRQPEWFAKASADLRAGKAVMLQPHGMGTGYTLSPRQQWRSDKRSAELEQTLGVTPIYISTFDAD